MKLILGGVIYLCMISAGIYCFLGLQINIWRHNGQNWCMLDCLHKLEQPWNFGFFYLPVTSWFVLMLKGVYTYPVFAVQYVRTDFLWTKLFSWIFGMSVLCGTYYSMAACMFSGLASPVVSNWTDAGSIFVGVNNEPYMGRVSWVICAYFLMNILKTLVMLCFLLLVEECLKNPVWGYLAFGVVTVAEWCLEGLRIFLNVWTISQKHFKRPLTIFSLLLAAIMAAVIVFFLGRWIWRRKEFYYENTIQQN